MNVRRSRWQIGLIVLMVGAHGFAFAYHTPEHFCEQCAVDNCGAGGGADPEYLDCIAHSCGEQCHQWAVESFSPGEACMGRCDEQWRTCIAESEYSGGLLDDHCVQAAASCFEACEGGSAVASDDEPVAPEGDSFVPDDESVTPDDDFFAPDDEPVAPDDDGDALHDEDLHPE